MSAEKPVARAYITPTDLGMLTQSIGCSNLDAPTTVQHIQECPRPMIDHVLKRRSISREKAQLLTQCGGAVFHTGAFVTQSDDGVHPNVFLHKYEKGDSAYCRAVTIGSGRKTPRELTQQALDCESDAIRRSIPLVLCLQNTGGVRHLCAVDHVAVCRGLCDERWHEDSHIGRWFSQRLRPCTLREWDTAQHYAQARALDSGVMAFALSDRRTRLHLDAQRRDRPELRKIRYFFDGKGYGNFSKQTLIEAYNIMNDVIQYKRRLYEYLADNIATEIERRWAGESHCIITPPVMTAFCVLVEARLEGRGPINLDALFERIGDEQGEPVGYKRSTLSGKMGEARSVLAPNDKPGTDIDRHPWVVERKNHAYELLCVSELSHSEAVGRQHSEDLVTL